MSEEQHSAAGTSSGVSKLSGLTPPSFGHHEKDYSTWLNELEIWRRMTDLPKQKQALAGVLVLQGRARSLALQIDAAALNTDEGLTTLLGKLGSVFKKEDVDCAYEAYATFEKFTRAEGSQMSSCIHEFED